MKLHVEVQMHARSGGCWFCWLADDKAVAAGHFLTRSPTLCLRHSAAAPMKVVGVSDNKGVCKMSQFDWPESVFRLKNTHLEKEGLS